MILETERLFIKELTVKDAPFFYHLVNDPDWLRFISDRNVNSIADAKDYLIAKIIPSYEKFGFGFYLVKTKNGTHSIRIAGLIDREGMEHVELGFAFLPKYRGKGYAYEARKEIMSYASTELKIEPLVAITDLENIKSAKLLEHLGFRFDKNIQLPDFEKPSKLFIPKK
ncbi:MAG: GNAT family N-acetyltransferase [Flavobacteriaceae bacterium]